MIRVECLCGKKLKAPGSTAGKTAKCPSCGGRVQVPSVAQPEVAQVASPQPLPADRPSAMTADTKLCPYCAEEIKAAAIVCRFCGRDQVPGGTGEALASAATAAKSSHTLEKTLWKASPAIWSYLGIYIFGALLVPVLLGIPILIWAILDRRNTVYTVSNRRITQKRGIIGKELSEVDLKDIRNIVLKRDIFDRLVNTGALGIATAGHAGIEIKLKGVPDPEGVRSLIDRAKVQAQEGQD